MSHQLTDTQIENLAAFYNIEVGVKPNKQTMKKIKADLKKYKAALKDNTLRNTRVTSKCPLDATYTTKKLKSERIITEYIPKTSTGAIKLSSGNKIHRLKYEYKRATVTTPHHGVVTKATNVQDDLEHRVAIYNALLDIIKNIE